MILLADKTTNTKTTTTQDALADLIKQYQTGNTYTPKTDAELQAQAKNEYQSYYDQLRLSAQQQQQRNDLALQQQKEGLQATYDKQRETTQKQYAQAYSQTDRNMLSRGMQRSSYTAQTLANLLSEGAKAQQDISDAQTAAEGNIDAQRQQYASQLADLLAQYDNSQAADELKRLDELKDKEYDRQQTSANTQNTLVTQLYQLLYQQDRDKVSDAQFDREFEKKYPSYSGSYSSSGSSGNSGASAGASAGTTGASANSGMTYDQLMDFMSGQQFNLKDKLIMTGLSTANKSLHLQPDSRR